MDTLSASSMSTIFTTTTTPTHRSRLHLHHFKTHLPHHSHAKPNPSNLSNKPTPHHNYFTTTTNPPLTNPSHSPTPSKSKQPHQKASTGYAVALLDVARCRNTLPAVERDVKRLSRWLRNHQLSTVLADQPRCKGEIARKGKFDKHLVKLVDLLINKGVVDILGEVLVEFGKMYDQLFDSKKSQVVMVSPGVRMEKSQLLGIAKSVQKLTGAEEVSVRQLIDTRLPSFAV